MTPQAGSLLIFALGTLETALALMLIGDAAYDDRSNAGRRVLFGGASLWLLRGALLRVDSSRLASMLATRR